MDRKLCIKCYRAFFWLPCTIPEDDGTLCNDCFYEAYPEYKPENIMNHPNYAQLVKEFWDESDT